MATHDELLAPMGTIGTAFGSGIDQDARNAAWELALTEDVVWDAPFTDPPIAVKGRRAVGLFFDWLISNVPNFATNLDNVYFIEDGQSYIVQVTGGGPTKDGDVYDQRYFSLIRIRDGKISYFREHFKAAETYRAFGRDNFHDSIAAIQQRADAGE